MNLGKAEILFLVRSGDSSIALFKGLNLAKYSASRFQTEDLYLMEQSQKLFSAAALTKIMLKENTFIRFIGDYIKQSYGIVYQYQIYGECWGNNYIRGFGMKSEDYFMNQNRFQLQTNNSDQEPIQLRQKEMGITDFDINSILNQQLSAQLQFSSFCNLDKKDSCLSMLTNNNQDHQQIWEKALEIDLPSQDLTEPKISQLLNSFIPNPTVLNTSIIYKCNCSKQSMISFLKQHSPSDLNQMLIDGNKESRCQCCNQLFMIEENEIKSAIESLSN